MLLMSLSVTSFPPSTLTVPLKSLALSSVMSSPAFRSVGPALTVRVLLAPWVMSPAVACKSKLATLTTPLRAMSVPAVTSNLPVMFTPPSVMLLMSLSVTSFPPSTLTVPLKSLAPLSTISAPAPAVVALNVAPPPETTTVPALWAIPPSMLVICVVPVVLRLPMVKPPAVSVMLVFPPTVMVPAVAWLKSWVTVRLPVTLRLPFVCVRVASVIGPVLVRTPPLWI